MALWGLTGSRSLVRARRPFAPLVAVLVVLTLTACGTTSERRTSNGDGRPATTKSNPAGASTATGTNSTTGSGTTTGVGSSPTAKAGRAVQNNIRDTILTDATVNCRSQGLPGRGHAFQCQLSSKHGNGTLTLTQQDAQGKCFLYTGQAGPYSWTLANHNVVCVQ